MIILDANAVSELMRPAPEPAVEKWVANQEAADLFLTAVTEAELRYGLAIMPAGQRRDALGSAIEGMLRKDFSGRILAFDSDSTRAYATIAASRRSAGRPASETDVQIAAIAYSHGMAVATRNVRDFEAMGIDVIDPWAAV